MVRGHRILFGAVASATALGLAACSGGHEGSGKTEEQANTAAECVPLADGYYLFQDGKFMAAPAPQPQVVERVVAPPAGWTGALEQSFAAAGYPWMGLNVRNRVATLTGTAPDPAAKERAFLAGEAAIKADPAGSAEIGLIVDGISVQDGEAGVGTGLLELAASDLTLSDCQKAFVDTMEGRNIEFELNKAAISPASARLLDAVSGVATLCNGYGISIEGHTDTRGSDSYNLQLSQERADAVKQYLADRGVDVTAITAIGYGETRPIDPAENAEAWAKNRRTEFKVSAR